MKISAAGIELIKEFEGCRLTSYVCPAGVLTIGYGSTGPHVKEGLTITPKEATDLLAKDLTRFEDAVNGLVKVPMTQGQFDALVSFAFNCGIGALQESTLLRLLNKEDYVAAAAQFDRWVMGPNGPLPGLVRRRDAEEALFRHDGVCSNAKAPVVHKSFKIKAKVETLLKKAPIAGAELAENEKSTVSAGKEYNVIWRSKEDGKHVKLSLDCNLGNWYVYAEHWEGLSDTAPLGYASQKGTGTLVLSTPYFSQRDNIASGNDMPYRTCFSSSSAMLAFTAKPGCVKGDDDYIKHRQAFGDSTNSDAQVNCLKSLGIKARFATDCSIDNIKKQLDKGFPVPCGILHHGPSCAPSGGGHWVCVVGYEPNGFIVNDPWGCLDHASGTYVSQDGKHVNYSYKLFDSRWTVSSSSDGWAILVD